MYNNATVLKLVHTNNSKIQEALGRDRLCLAKFKYELDSIKVTVRTPDQQLEFTTSEIVKHEVTDYTVTFQTGNSVYVFVKIGQMGEFKPITEIVMAN